MFGYVYRTRNTTNDTYYIGQRRGPFTTAYLGSGIRLIAAAGKYGRDAFEVQLLDFASFQEELDALEIHYIKVHRDCGVELYNIASGGQRGCMFGLHHSAETRRKIGIKSIGRRQSDAGRASISRAQKGQPKSPEHRAAISRALSGKLKSPEHCAANAASHVNSPACRDHRDRLAAMRLGQRLSEDHRRHIGDAFRGKPWTVARRDAHTRKYPHLSVLEREGVPVARQS